MREGEDDVRAAVGKGCRNIFLHLCASAAMYAAVAKRDHAGTIVPAAIKLNVNRTPG